MDNATGLEIAVIGMAGRFPGALNINEYWSNMVNGVNSISFFTEDELKESGVTSELMENDRYVQNDYKDKVPARLKDVLAPCGCTRFRGTSSAS